MSRSAPGRIVEFAALLDADGFSGRDGDMIDVMPVPDRLEDRVAEAQCHDVLHRLLAEEMIDPIDLRLVENAQNLCIERLSRWQIAAERLFDDNATKTVRRFANETRLTERVHDGSKILRRRGEIKGDIAIADLFFQGSKPVSERPERAFVLEITRHVG